MREAARALDDVSDHLGEVLRRSDELLAEWSRFGAQVRTQVDREVAAIGGVIDGAVTRAASVGLDRAIADRLRALTGELERLEQRTRAASRAVAEQRDGDRRVLWIVVAGVVLANALLVALLLRKPDAAPVAEPIRIESPAAERSLQAGPEQGSAAAAGSADTTGAVSTGSAALTAEANAPGGGGSGANAGGNAAAANAGGNAAGAKPGSPATLNAAAKPAPPPGNAAKQPEADGPAKPVPSPIALPPKAGTPRPHKKLP